MVTKCIIASQSIACEKDTLCYLIWNGRRVADKFTSIPSRVM